MNLRCRVRMFNSGQERLKAYLITGCLLAGHSWAKLFYLFSLRSPGSFHEFLSGCHDFICMQARVNVNYEAQTRLPCLSIQCPPLSIAEFSEALPATFLAASRELCNVWSFSKELLYPICLLCSLECFRFYFNLIDFLGISNLLSVFFLFKCLSAKCI